MKILSFILILYCSLGWAQIQKEIRIVQPLILLVNAGVDEQIVSGNSVVIGGNPSAKSGTPGYSYLWQPSIGLSNYTIANPSAYPTLTTAYFLTVTDSKGCTDTDTIIVTVVPAAIDDYFVADDFEISFNKNSEYITVSNNSLFNFFNLNISVYNILGQVLFTSTFSGLPAKENIQINYSGYMNGAYILKLKNTKQTVYKKFVTN